MDVYGELGSRVSRRAEMAARGELSKDVGDSSGGAADTPWDVG
jgi:hypothetical protein